MKTLNLNAPLGQGLGGANLVELNKEELMEIEGEDGCFGFFYYFQHSVRDNHPYLHLHMKDR